MRSILAILSLLFVTAPFSFAAEEQEEPQHVGESHERPPPDPEMEVGNIPVVEPGEPEISPPPRGVLQPDELGQIMILEYHIIGAKEDRWERTPENFRKDMEDLYQ